MMLQMQAAAILQVLLRIPLACCSSCNDLIAIAVKTIQLVLRFLDRACSQIHNCKHKVHNSNPVCHARVLS